MRKSIVRWAIALLLAAGATGLVAADAKQNASWFLYEQGNTAMARREYGEALQLYKEAIAGSGAFPEAEIGLGDIYFEEGETGLAVAQYQKAYNMRKYFYIPDQQYGVLYKLARVYESQRQYKQMEDALTTIEADDRHFVETDTYKLRTQVAKLYRERGLNRVLTLYSFDDTLFAAAHSKLGWFFYRTGRYTQATEELLFSVIYRTGALAKMLHERDVDYGFTTLGDFLAAVEKSADLQEYAATYDLYKDLYYLAGATFADGLPEHAVELWKILAASSSAGAYRDLASRQVKKPWIEPLIGASPGS
ncbi:MAG TPA: hypothetical protein VHE79_00985 [Spirochaetia bacterium]